MNGCMMFGDVKDLILCDESEDLVILFVLC